jgi:FAD/FMN-containing dehydrogenase
LLCWTVSIKLSFQKEGCDGFITSAQFILHQPLAHINTLCLEFFGYDLDRAVSAIVAIKDSPKPLLRMSLALIVSISDFMGVPASFFK